MMKREKIEFLDLFRALAIFAVVTIHATSEAVASLPTDSLIYPLYPIVNTAAHFAVPAFLFLSSLVLFYNYDGRAGIDWPSFYTKRLQSIVFPYLLWSGIYFLLVTVRGGYALSERWPIYFRGLLDGGNYTHLYFFVILLQLLVLFPLLLWLAKRPFVRSNLIPIGIVLQLAFYIGNYYFFHMSKVGTFAGSYLLYFFLGAHAGLKLKTNASWLSKANAYLYGAVLLLVCGYVGQYMLATNYPHYLPRPWPSRIHFLSVYAYCGVFCYFLIHLSSQLLARGRALAAFLKSVGVASFGIFLIHPLVLVIWRKYAMVNGPIVYHLLIWSGGAVALLASWGITLLVKRIRWGSLVLGLERGRPNQTLKG
jgi:probable poly-beta-1,6-N-acetyl-D-glucosamine export protein